MSVYTAGDAARLHAPGGPAAGEPVQVRLEHARLHVTGARHWMLDAAKLEATIGGFDHDSLFLSWLEGEDRYTVQLDRPDFAALRAAAPPELALQLGRFGASVDRQRWLWRAIGGAAAVIALAIGLSVWRFDALVGWTADQVSPETEKRLGAQVVKGLRAEGKLVEEGPAVEAIATIGARLTQGSRYEYRWYVQDEDVVNAFAAPGGVVVVYRGLLEKARSPEELAAVLAHEVQHVELRHSLRNMIASLGWAAVLMVALGDVGTIAGVVIHQAGSMSYSRDLEREADMRGVAALAAAGIPPQPMIDFFVRLAAEDGTAIAFLSSHPATTERVERLRADAAALGPVSAKPLEVDWAAVQASLGRLEHSPKVKGTSKPEKASESKLTSGG